MSTSSDPWAAGEPPEWLGDVSVGVDAWTRRAAPAETPRPAKATRTRRQARPTLLAAEPVDEVTSGPEADPESVARKILLDQLTGQARSRKELADKLAKKLVPEEIATRLLDRFEEVGLIDDAAFARLWIDSRQAGKGLARRALAQELRRKGIADEVAREALDAVDPSDEEAAARVLVQRKLRTMSRLDDVTKTRRLLGMLARKGYPSGLAMTVIRSEVAGVPESDA
ncbi:regulatory protein RecX [Nocardioides sp. Iso805N]|uniref:regulatory protein RecX n=1 Tax=Nocardioides sp. Iso805N TaxID=1283287 RepID=UPI0003772E0D|nr:regulatory protein RecX [Nocardioides sp. Iso805N]